MTLQGRPEHPSGTPRRADRRPESLESRYDFKRVLVAVDESEGSENALDCAISICRAVDAELTALAVERKLPAYAALQGDVDAVKAEKGEDFNRVLDHAMATAAASDIAIETELIPRPAAAVINHYARAHGHDLIVTGHRGHFLADSLLSSTADHVAHDAYCPVMAVR